MNLFISLREALSSLSANKLRSSLTILGIVIGVGAVIAMVAIGRGATSSVTSSIQGIGTNLIFISAGSAPGSTTTVRNPKTLTLDDAKALANSPAVAAVAPIIQGRFDITYGSQTSSTEVTGVTSGYQTVRNATLSEGTFITDAQVNGRLSVAVIGADTAKTLFSRATNLVGQVIRINGQQFHIVGVLKAKGGSSSSSTDDIVLIPITTAQTRLMHRFTSGSVDTIQVQATSANSVNDAVNQVTQILSLRHGTKVGVNDFTVRTQADILSTAQSITGVLTMFLGGIAGISLLVGGIGIMNIMLVSVTERTKEIGLRKALGARRRDILLQFLTESILLGLVGGLLGVLLAWGITSAVEVIAAANSSAITAQIGVDSVLLATIFSMAVGLAFGLYPANRAARLMPVEALRFE
jgi:putative ABC transport system permease protein